MPDAQQSLDALLMRHRAAIQAEMAASLPSSEPCLAQLDGMIRYSVGWVDEHFQADGRPSGKLLRPALCIASCEALGGAASTALPAAAALEWLHNFSLVHDDIEDQDEERRHRATTWRAWGAAQAINTGDAMFSVARLALWRLAGQGVSAETMLQAAQRFDQTCLGLCEGQYLDMSFPARDDVSTDLYLTMIGRKTALLMELSCELGALCAGASAALTGSLGRFGHALGMAFQLRDDMLGIWGDPRQTGKTAAGDVVNRKRSLPVLHALTALPATRADRLRALYAQPGLLGAPEVTEALGILEEARARDAIAAALEEHAEQAADLLRGVPTPADDRGRDALSALETLLRFVRHG